MYIGVLVLIVREMVNYFIPAAILICFEMGVFHINRIAHFLLAFSLNTMLIWGAVHILRSSCAAWFTLVPFN